MRIIMFFTTFLLLANLACADSLPNAPHIAVDGTHQIKVTPDTLKISLEIIEVSTDVTAARNIVEKRSTKLIKSAQTIGITKKDINSAALSLVPRYNWQNNQQIYTGTEISRRVIITLRDLSKYDDLIKAILDANVARINNSSLSYSRIKEARTEALRQAVVDARTKAKMLTGDLPQRLGSVYSIKASPGTPTPFRGETYKAVATALEAGTNSAFEPGTMELSESVHVVFYLINE